MATASDGVSVHNMGSLEVAPDTNGAPGTYVDLSIFLASCTVTIEPNSGNSTSANSAITQSVDSGRPTISWEASLYKSKAAAGVDATLEPFAISGGVFHLRMREAGAASASNKSWLLTCHSLSGYTPVTVDANRTDAATVDISSMVNAYSTDDGT